MRDRIDVHGHKRRYELAVRNLKRDRKLSDVNRKTILRFTWDMQAEGLSIPRLVKYLYLLPRLGKWLVKDFEKANVEDLKRLVTTVNKSDYADWTKSDFRITLKRFYRWLRKLPKGQDPPETAWIRTQTNNKPVLPEELLTEEDVMKLAEAAENSRDRAFVLSTYETGGRVAELLNLRRKHIAFDQYGCFLMFSGKTGDRRPRLILSAPALAQWLEDHPLKDPDSPFWIVTGDRNHSQPLLYDATRNLLKTLAKKAGVKKKVNPQAFRHARASFLANFMTERQMEQYLGWAVGSRMPKIYVHMSGRETDNVLLQMHGITKEPAKQQKPKLTIIACQRCETKNGPTAKFCVKCGMPLLLEAALELEKTRKEADELMSRLLEDPEVRALLLAKLKALSTQFEVEPQDSILSSA